MQEFLIMMRDKAPGNKTTIARLDCLKRIMFKLAEEPLTQAEIGDEFEIAGSTVRKHLNTLMESGLVFQIGEKTNTRGHAVKYGATKELYNVFVVIVNMIMKEAADTRSKSRWIKARAKQATTTRSNVIPIIPQRDPLTAAFFGSQRFG